MSWENCGHILLVCMLQDTVLVDRLKDMSIVQKMHMTIIYPSLSLSSNLVFTYTIIIFVRFRKKALSMIPIMSTVASVWIMVTCLLNELYESCINLIINY